MLGTPVIAPVAIPLELSFCPHHVAAYSLSPSSTVPLALPNFTANWFCVSSVLGWFNNCKPAPA